MTSLTSRAESASVRVGNLRPRSFQCLEKRRVAVPWRNASARKPSNFTSKSQSPAGTDLAALAFIGSTNSGTVSGRDAIFTFSRLAAAGGERPLYARMAGSGSSPKSLRNYTPEPLIWFPQECLARFICFVREVQAKTKTL
jgi:hypothetical protein